MDNHSPFGSGANLSRRSEIPTRAGRQWEWSKMSITMALEYKQQTFCKFASIDTPNDTDALDLVSDPEGHPV